MKYLALFDCEQDYIKSKQFRANNSNYLNIRACSGNLFFSDVFIMNLNLNDMANSSPIEVQKYLKGVDYPATKEDLIDKARSNGAKKEILSLIEELREDEFANPAEVSKGIGELV